MKKKVIILVTVLSAVFFAGCNTTGSSGSAATIQVNKMGDGNMTCEQIVIETNQMNEILGIAEGEMRTAQMLGLTQSAAVNAALYSGALAGAGSSLPYLGSAINMAGSLNQMNQQQAEERAEAAFNRRSVLTGMYAAKGCGQ
ncbi:hypothetical protein QEH59_01175 [Coraliomargarita sp. SDUM461004]|uniref:Lipoprotein n=1 Tax=Thalassobacterium sedimentorum TaxID=3041258 RepID=A0ABU1AEA4_9BACT|nr:hypothetical protein [Coraliomargarita sp. SDUM461004]MDQ8193018.1 hypothetical protein [Coraliomargarita sp. SDUM461004]